MKQRRLIRTGIRHGFAFPAIVLFTFTILVIFGISGTSIGVVDQHLYGSVTKDPSLIFGKLRPVRSDEFVVNTQLTIAQAKSGFPLINKDISDGINMSVLVDVPYGDWSVAFKPQNLAFFVMPFENAFAFRWWVLLVILILSVYALSLHFMPKKYLWATLIAVISSCNPFIWWWYQSGTILPLAFGVLILVLSLKFFDGTLFTKYRPVIRYTLSSIIFAYCMATFALALYPPFQIPVLLVVAFFLVGYVIEHWRKIPNRVRHLVIFAGSALVALGIVGIFVITRLDAFQAISNTAYPGKRVSQSGDYDINRLLVAYLQPELQSNKIGNSYISNQSESATSLIQPIIFLLPFLGVVVLQYIHKRKFDWVLIMLILCNLLFLAHLFLPQFTGLNKIFLLSYVPTIRLIEGYCMLVILSMVYTVYVARNNSFLASQRVRYVMVIYSGIVFFLGVLAMYVTRQSYPGFVPSVKLALILNVILCAGYLFIFIRKFTAGFGILALFSMASIFYVNPLYHGVGTLRDSDVVKSISSVAASDKDALWGFYGLIYFENLPQIAGVRSATGVMPYPNISFWKKYATDPAQEFIYNRYAHTQLSSSDEEFHLVQQDLYTISDHCSMDIMQDMSYIVSSVPLSEPCLVPISTTAYPATTFYIYKISR